MHQISAKQTHEEVIAGRLSGLIELGESVTWRAKHFGFFQELTSKITAFEKPNSFTDEMVSGAFKSFKHIHKFEPTHNGTIMVDVFSYISPLGTLGNFLTIFFKKIYGKSFNES